MRILNRKEVEDALDLDKLIDALADAMADLSSGAASVPPRVAARVLAEEAFLGAMPGYLPSSSVLESKLVTVFPRNAGRGLPTHQAVMVLFDAATGTPLALLDATSVTAIRTGAGSALATRLLARENASVAAIVGTGVQARSHAMAISRVRRLREMRVAGRDEAKARALAAELAEELELPVHASVSYEEAVRGADIVCATTHSPEPVIRRAWLSPGTHVNSVGYNPDGREVDADTVVDALLVVESRASALAPFPSGANDLLWPIRDGLITPDHVHAEVGEVVMGTKRGRTSPDQITLYKSVGVAVQDAAAGALVWAAATERHIGVEVEL
jgi:alanine dehydrogenase